MDAATFPTHRSRVARWVGPFATAVAVVLGPVAPAEASQVGFEGSEIVVRADQGEPMNLFRVKVDPAAGTLTAEDYTEVARADGPPGIPSFRRRGAPRPGDRCQAGGTETAPATICPLAGATGVNVDWTGAVPGDPAKASPGRKPMYVIVVGGSLPVVYQGSAGTEELDVTTDGRVTADTQGGDDALNVIAPVMEVLGGDGNDLVRAGNGAPPPAGPPSRVDAGPGDDQVLAGLSADSVVLGGPGNDGLDVSTYNADPATQARQPVLRQVVDCGDGADTVRADARDVAGTGCVATPTGLREGMTLGRFDRRGTLRLAGGRVGGPASVRYRIDGPAPPAFRRSVSVIAYTAPPVKALGRLNGAIRTTVPAVTRVRKRLRTQRRPIRGVRAVIDLRRVGETGGDLTTVTVSGVLRPRR
jgi:hypothetical protein